MLTAVLTCADLYRVLTAVLTCADMYRVLTAVLTYADLNLVLITVLIAVLTCADLYPPCVDLFFSFLSHTYSIFSEILHFVIFFGLPRLPPGVYFTHHTFIQYIGRSATVKYLPVRHSAC